MNRLCPFTRCGFICILSLLITGTLHAATAVISEAELLAATTAAEYETLIVSKIGEAGIGGTVEFQPTTAHNISTTNRINLNTAEANMTFSNTGSGSITFTSGGTTRYFFVYTAAGSATFNNLNFENATNDAIFCQAGVALTLINCTFTGNNTDFDTEGSGGTVLFGPSTIDATAFTFNDLKSSIEDPVTIRDGYITGGTWQIGARTYKFNSETPLSFTFSTAIDIPGVLTFNNTGTGSVTFDGNNTTRLFNVNNGTTTFDQNFTFTQANASAIFVANNCTLNVNHSMFINNVTTSNGGGAILANENGSGITLILTNSTFSGNSTMANGGAIQAQNVATLTMSNCTFFGNVAGSDGGGDGGAIVQWNTGASGTFTIDHCTFSGNISDNNASSTDGGVNLKGDNYVYNITNCIFDEKVNMAINTTTSNDTETNNYYSDTITGGFTPTNQITGTLNLDALADNGGLVQTMALTLGSACIDAATTTTGSDARGANVYNGTRDVGAFEYDPTFTPAIGLEIEIVDGVLVWRVEQEIGVAEYRVFINGEIFATRISADGSGYYTFVLPETYTSVRLAVIDLDGFTQTFAPTRNTLVLEIAEGWNLLSLNLSVTAAEFDKVTAVADAAIQSWVNGQYQLIETPTALQGFWVYASESATVELTGTPVAGLVDLENGWNLVGPARNCLVPPNTLSYGFGEKYEQLLDQGLLLLGQGYWIYSEVDQSVELY